jgi:hypothetical protein
MNDFERMMLAFSLGYLLARLAERVERGTPRYGSAEWPIRGDARRDE